MHGCFSCIESVYFPHAALRSKSEYSHMCIIHVHVVSASVIITGLGWYRVEERVMNYLDVCSKMSLMFPSGQM